MATSSTIVGHANAALKAIWRDGYPYKKAGVVVSGIVPENEIQLGFDVSMPDVDKHKRLMRTTDALRGRYGHCAISVGTPFAAVYDLLGGNFGGEGIN